MQLHQLAAQYKRIEDLLDEEDADESLEMALAALEDDIESTGINLIKTTQNAEATVEALKKTRDRINTRIKWIETNVLKAKKKILDGMVKTGINKIECDYFKISLRNNSGRVEILDEETIPEDYVRYIETRVPDKKRIKEDLLKGAEIKGVVLIKTKSLMIK